MVLRRSIRILVVPRVLVRAAYPAARLVALLSEPPHAAAENGGAIVRARKSRRNPAQFLPGANIDISIDVVPTCPDRTHPGDCQFMRSTRPIAPLGLFRPVLAFQNPLDFRAQKPFTRCPTRLAEWSFWNPFGSDRRGPKHTRAEQVES